MTAPLRIVYLNPAPPGRSDGPHGGPDAPDPERLLERHATMTGWCAALARTGASVSALQLFGRDAAASADGVTYRFIRAPRGAASLRSFPRFLSAAASLRPDVIHAGGMPLLFRSLRKGLPRGAVVVWQHHGGGFPRLPLRPLWRRGFSAVDALFFTAAEQAAEWRPMTGALPVVEIPEGSTTLTAAPRDAARRSLGIGDEELLLWVGRLDANKDPLTAIRGVSLARRKGRPILLALAYGADELLAEARRLSGESGLPVRFLGRLPREELRLWYSAADAFVLGSRREGSGYALIEAMACGCPPVVAGIPPFRRLAGGIGLFWEPGDPNSLADALTSPVRPARERVAGHFRRELAWEAVAARALAAYASLRAEPAA